MRYGQHRFNGFCIIILSLAYKGVERVPESALANELESDARCPMHDVHFVRTVVYLQRDRITEL